LQQTCGDLTFLKMAAFRHPGLLKFTLLTVGASLHHPTKFCENPSNCSRDDAIFVFFKIAADLILDIQKFEIVVVVST